MFMSEIITRVISEEEHQFVVIPVYPKKVIQLEEKRFSPLFH